MDMKITRILGWFSAIVFAVITLSFVDFHSSMTKVDYNPANGVLKFTTKMSAPDLQSALNVNSKSAEFKDAAKRYVSQNISVRVNNSPISLTYTGSQVNGESVRVYYESAGVNNVETLQIKNTILLNEFASQMNVVNIAYKGIQKTMTFQRGKEVDQVRF